jgi:hypothetical protein
VGHRRSIASVLATRTVRGWQDSRVLVLCPARRAARWPQGRLALALSMALVACGAEARAKPPVPAGQDEPHDARPIEVRSGPATMGSSDGVCLLCGQQLKLTLVADCNTAGDLTIRIRNRNADPRKHWEMEERLDVQLHENKPSDLSTQLDRHVEVSETLLVNVTGECLDQGRLTPKHGDLECRITNLPLAACR